jgi:ABC-type uncharacterized transport system permease subunit
MPNVFFIIYSIYVFLSAARMNNLEQKIGFIIGIIFSLLIINTVLTIFYYIFKDIKELKKEKK